MLSEPFVLPVVGVPEVYYAAPLLAGLRERADLRLTTYPPDALERAQWRQECVCALAPPAALLRNPALRVLPGAGVVASAASPSERLLSTVPLDAIRQVQVRPGAASLIPYVQVLFAERNIASPEFTRVDEGADCASGASLVSGDRGLAATDAAGYDLAALWQETTGLPMVLGVWACTAMASYRMLRQVLGEAARRGEEMRITAGGASAPDAAGGRDPSDALYYTLLSLESDSLRAFHALAKRYLSDETTAEAIVFC